MKGDSIGGLEEFSLRWARALLIGAIALGCLAIGGGLLVAGGAWVVPGPKKPAALLPPEPVKFTLQLAEKWSAAHATEKRQLEQAALAVDAPGPIPASLTALFPSPAYATTDVWEEYCKVPSDYGCIQKGKRLTVPSAGRTFSVLFKDVGEEDQAEFVKVLQQQLSTIPVEKRLGMVAPILVSYFGMKAQNREALKAHEAKASDAEELFLSAVRSHRDGQLAFSIGGLWVALWGLGTVVSASVFVALLAIERHLRDLRSRSAPS